jgi:hypothetical protein
MFEAIASVLVKVSGGHLAEVFFGTGFEGTARLCTHGHPDVWLLDEPIPPGEVHLDVQVRAWSTGGRTVTIVGFKTDRMKQSMSIDLGLQPESYTLDRSGKPVSIEFRVMPVPKGSPVAYRAGEKLPLNLQTNRGYVKKVSVQVVT